MALTVKTNGSAPANLINASWFNDIRDLLTGVMTDQPVTIANSVTLTGASGSLTVSGSLKSSAGSLVHASQQSGAANGHVFQSWTGSALATPFSVGGQFNSAPAYITNTGDLVCTTLPTSRNGVVTQAYIFTGTTTPVSPPTGSIWIKA